MRCNSSFRQYARSFLTALLLLLGTAEAYGADTYNPSNRQLTIPSVTIGSATYSNMVVTVGSVVGGPTGTTPNGSEDSYNAASGQLTVPSVMIGTTPYDNVVVMVVSLVSISSVTGADTYNGSTLTIPSVQVLGGAVYNNVVVSVSSIVSVTGGMPTVARDLYNPATNRLTIPAVQFEGKVYTNVTITVGKIMSLGAKLQSISVTPTNPSAANGLITVFTAIGNYSNGTSQNITLSATWTSSNTAVATIIAGGRATNIAAGSSVISAAVGNIAGSTTLTVTGATLQGITVTPADSSIPAIFTSQFTAIGSYSDGTSQDITASATWTSSSPAFATVVAGGLASGVAAGSSLISANFGGFTGSTTLTVIATTLQSIAVTPGNPTIPVALTRQFAATGKYSDGSTYAITSSVTWVSGTTAVATVGPSGLAAGIGAGSAVITATMGGISGSTTLTVITTSGAFDGTWVGTMNGTYTDTNWGCSGVSNTTPFDGGMEAIITNGAIQYEVPVASGAVPGPGQTSTITGMYIEASGNANWELVTSYGSPSGLAPGMNVFSSIGAFTANGSASGTWTFTWSGAPCIDYVDGSGSGTWSMSKQ